MLRRMGPLKGVLKMIPGLSQQLGDVDIDDRELGRVEAIVLSMTPLERGKPIVIDGKRRLRIARGSGTTVEQVNNLLAARKQMEKMMKQMGRGKLPALPNQQAPGGAPSATRKSVVEAQEKEGRTEVKESDGCETEAHTRGLEEEPDLPRRRRRLALAA